MDGSAAYGTGARASCRRRSRTPDFGVEVAPAQVQLGRSCVEVLGYAKAPYIHFGVDHAIHRHGARDGCGAEIASSSDTRTPVRVAEELTVNGRITKPEPVLGDAGLDRPLSG